jgi:hypothetical protein
MCLINALNVDIFLGHLYGVKVAKSAQRGSVLEGSFAAAESSRRKSANI